MWAVDPKLMLLPNGALAVSAGRPGVGLWISSDGSGSLWKYQNLLLQNPLQHLSLPLLLHL